MWEQIISLTKTIQKAFEEKNKPDPSFRFKFADGVATPCPWCKSRMLNVRGGAGSIGGKYLLEVRCRECGGDGCMAISPQVAKKVQKQLGTKVEWKEKNIVLKKR